MNPNFIPLEELRIARPCRADWDRMTGDERTRFCGSCHKNVYDLSQMTRAEAQQLIAEREGNVCVRLYRRPDGTVITSDCPVGQRDARRPMWWTLAGFVALMASGAAVWSRPTNDAPDPSAPRATLTDKARRWPVVGALANKVSPQPVLMGDVAAPPVLGRIAVPTPKPQPTSAPTMGRPVAPIATSQPTMGEPAPVCLKPQK